MSTTWGKDPHRRRRSLRIPHSHAGHRKPRHSERRPAGSPLPRAGTGRRAPCISMRSSPRTATALTSQSHYAETRMWAEPLNRGQRPTRRCSTSTARRPVGLQGPVVCCPLGPRVSSQDRPTSIHVTPRLCSVVRSAARGPRWKFVRRQARSMVTLKPSGWSPTRDTSLSS